MTFGQVLDLLKFHGGYIRLPYWNENTKVNIRYIIGFTDNCLVVESDKGQIAWIPNMVELLSQDWEWYEHRPSSYSLIKHYKYLLEKLKKVEKIKISESYLGYKIAKIYDNNTDLLLIIIKPYSFIFIDKYGEDEIHMSSDYKEIYTEISNILEKLEKGENNEKCVI